MTSRRAIVALVAVQCLLSACIAIVALDLYAHKKTEMLAGLNMRGYRGPVAHQKQPREIRVAVIGGTRAFGLGMPASWTIATVLRQQVMLVTDQRGGEVRQVVPLTLARPGALPDSYVETLEHFEYLKPDYVCIYDDLGVGGAPLPEETSGVFARTGYWPALPVVLQEKGRLWRFGTLRAGGSRDAAQPSALARGAGVLLQATGASLARLDRAIARQPVTHRADDPEQYAAQMMTAVDAALSHARGVVVALAPAESRRQAASLAALLPRLNNRAAATPALRLVNLANERVLLDASQRLDEWNYGGDAIAAAAKAITPAMIDLITR